MFGPRRVHFIYGRTFFCGMMFIGRLRAAAVSCAALPKPGASDIRCIRFFTAQRLLSVQRRRSFALYFGHKTESLRYTMRPFFYGAMFIKCSAAAAVFLPYFGHKTESLRYTAHPFFYGAMFIKRSAAAAVFLPYFGHKAMRTCG
jgi:hypothetical protein